MTYCAKSDRFNLLCLSAVQEETCNCSKHDGSILSAARSSGQQSTCNRQRDWTIFGHHNKDGPVSSTARKVLHIEVYPEACKQMSKQEQHAL
jgi:hypothetical protein